MQEGKNLTLILCRQTRAKLISGRCLFFSFYSNRNNLLCPFDGRTDACTPIHSIAFNVITDMIWFVLFPCQEADFFLLASFILVSQVVRKNKYWNIDDQKSEGKFHIFGQCSTHIKGWERVRPAKLSPEVAKNDIAYSQQCAQCTYVASILHVSTNISHSGGTGCFVSLWLYLVVFFPWSCELWHR